MPPSLRRLLALIPWLASLGVQAAGLGQIEVASFLGEPLRVSVALNLEEGTLPLDSCVRIAAPSRQQPDLARATVDVISENGRHYVAIRTRAAVNEPVLDLTLHADGCGLSIQKDYVILLSPRDFDLAPAPIAAPVAAVPAAQHKTKAASRSHKAHATGTKKPRRSGARPSPRKTVAASTPAQPGPAPAAPAPVSPPAGNRLVLTAPETEAPIPSAPPAPAVSKPGPGSERSGLVTNVEGAVAKSTPTSTAWLPYLLAALALIVLAVAVAWWLTRRKPVRAGLAGPMSALDTIEPELQELRLPTRPLRIIPTTAEVGVAEPPPRQVPAAVPRQPEPTRSEQPANRPAPEPLAFDTVRPGSEGIEAKTIQPADILTEAPVTTSLDHVMELAEVMLAFGRSGQAIEALSQHIRDNPRQSVDPWLKLLDLYHQSDLRNEFDALAAELHRHYNVAITEWASYATDPGTEALTLESLPHILARLSETWGTQACLDYLDKLLKDNRGGQRLGFSMALVRDILLLRGMLRQFGLEPASHH